MSFIVHPSKWEVQHARAIFSGQAYQAAHDGQLPDTPMWRMLEFRHSLNAARFDHWHPNVGLILERRDPFLDRVPFTQHDMHGWVGHMRGPVEELGRLAPESLASMPTITIPPPPTDVWAWRAIEPAPPHILTQSVPEPSAALQGMTALALAVAVMVKRYWPRRLVKPDV